MGGSGYIRDLKIDKSSDSMSVASLPGYQLIPVDLNKGAGGKYIYLTFTRSADHVQQHIPQGCEDIIPGPYVTSIYADDWNAVDALGVKGTCLQSSGLYWEYLPLVQPTGVPYYWEWKQPDLNDGSGGRFIYAWQTKRASAPPIAEVGVIAGNNGSIACPSGWTRIDQDLNQGAGGDYIYFCYRL